MLIDIIAGARPNFMKIAPIIHALQERNMFDEQLKFRLIHTGQHYDEKMSDNFFKQLRIPVPDINLGVGSGTQADQTGLIMKRYESALLSQKCELCLVVGDVNSTMACAIVAQKMKVSVAHVEGGIRSNDWTMPEEINRRVTDAISNWFFTTSEFANQNLIKEGVQPHQIYFVGNTMIDTLLANLENLCPPSFFSELGLQTRSYIVLTLHRPSNVDDISRLHRLLIAISEASRDATIIFPVHPRTKMTLKKILELPSNFVIVDPQSYLEFNYLVKNSLAVITDSGGITEEATVMNIPCITIRDNTERPETISEGTNVLVGSDPVALRSAVKQALNGTWKEGRVPALWDGHAGERIVDALGEIARAMTHR